MKKKEDEAQVRLRAELILKVRAGLMTASEAAKKLGVSRKTYYKWERRALAGMLEGLSERKSGRPASPVDKEKEALKKRVKELETRVCAQDRLLDLREVLKFKPEKKS
jgi:transposase